MAIALMHLATSIAAALAAQADVPASIWICWEGESVKLTDEVKKDYEERFASCTVKPEKKNEVEAIVTRIMKNRNVYEDLEAKSGVPWYAIAVLHDMEGGGSFKKHLHNGNPLSARTYEVPANRPLEEPKGPLVGGKRSFTFEQSALDALALKFTGWTNFTLAGLLFKIESFNGFGYRGYKVPSPYLWGASNHERPGKYIRDHVFDPNAVTKQIGAAVLLRRLADQHLIELGSK